MVKLPSLQTLPQKIIHENLSGTNGSNRDRQHPCQINAHNDFEAIQCWLNEYRAKPTTFRAYQKEAERFLLWAVFQHGKPLSSLDRDDFATYCQFLDDPEPKEIWCGKVRGNRSVRGSDDWRPFTGPLSHTAKMMAISILDSLFNYLVTASYLTFNPLSLMRRRTKKNSLGNAFKIEERILTIEEWHAMIDVMESWPESTLNEKKEKERLIFIIYMLYFLGLRVSELTSHHWNAVRKIDDQWWFYVRGKGDKIGRVPINDNLLRAIVKYRASLAKPPYPTPSEIAPLIISFTTGDAISPRHINKILKKLALETSKKFSAQPEKMHKLKKFSAHWLRHLSASMQDRVGISFKHIRANHRHENDETTRRYVHAIDNERHEEMQKLTLKIRIL